MRKILALIACFSSISFGSPLSDKLVDAALERITHTVRYDGRYLSISYPNGDVPSDMGVCTDVINRSYRKLGVDLQKQIHEDMALNFSEYPSKRIWGLSKTDKNIDHRRVPNLQVFFSRKGEVLDISDKPGAYNQSCISTA